MKEADRCGWSLEADLSFSSVYSEVTDTQGCSAGKRGPMEKENSANLVQPQSMLDVKHVNENVTKDKSSLPGSVSPDSSGSVW